MAAIEKGRVCHLLRGRHAGEKVVVVRVGEGHLVEVASNRLPPRSVNIRHLLPANRKTDPAMLSPPSKKAPSAARLAKTASSSAKASGEREPGAGEKQGPQKGKEKRA